MASVFIDLAPCGYADTQTNAHAETCGCSHILFISMASISMSHIAAVKQALLRLLGSEVSVPPVHGPWL